MSRVLILYAHPAMEKSRVHSRLLQRLPARPDVTLHDLYEEYPSFAVDVDREQEMLSKHELVIFQHPLFWYSTPPLLKQWIDLVLEHGWAYGSEGHALRGKRALSLVTAGGNADAYRADGYNRFTIRQFLAPIEQTTRLCGMDYWPPYVIFGTHRMNEADIERQATRYHDAIELLADDRLDFDRTSSRGLLNEAVAELARPEAGP